MLRAEGSTPEAIPPALDEGARPGVRSVTTVATSKVRGLFVRCMMRLSTGSPVGHCTASSGANNWGQLVLSACKQSIGANSSKSEVRAESLLTAC